MMSASFMLVIVAGTPPTFVIDERTIAPTLKSSPVAKLPDEI